MKKEYIFLTLVILGPNSPGRRLDVYLRSLIDELKILWEDRLTLLMNGRGKILYESSIVVDNK